MSGVRGFVYKGDARQSTPPPHLPPQPSSRGGRHYAQGLKIGGKKPINNGQVLPSTVPNPGYASNPGATRNTYPAPQYAHQDSIQQVQDRKQLELFGKPRNAFDDSTIDSDFDNTITNGSLGLQVDGYGVQENEQQYREPDSHVGEHGYGGQENEHQYRQPDTHDMGDGPGSGAGSTDEDDDYVKAIISNEEARDINEDFDRQPRRIVQVPATQHLLHRKQSQSPVKLVAEQSPSRKLGISGRFTQKPQAPQQQTTGLQLRPLSGANQKNTSSKRGHSSEDGYQRTEGENAPRYLLSEPTELEEEEEEERSFRSPSTEMAEQNQRHEGANAGKFEASSVGEASFDEEGPSRGPLTLSEQLSNAIPEYDDQALKSLKFADLLNESFEKNPNGPKTQALPELLPGSLSDKITHYVRLHKAEQKEGLDLSNETRVLYVFFANMTKDEWEESGDYFLDRFGQVLQKLKEARKKKRETITNLEKVMGDRETVVREKRERYGKELEEMRLGGRAVIKGKKI